MPNPSNEWYTEWYEDSKRVLQTRNNKFVPLIEYGDNTTLIDSAYQLIKKIEKEKDTLNCYGFTQVDKIFYKDFVFMLDQCQVHGLYTYMLMSDTLLIYHYSPNQEAEADEKEEKNTWVGCGTREANYRVWKQEQDAKDSILRLSEFKKTSRNYIIEAGIGHFGMLFFYFILPFIQSKISSK